jgi:hypothetical protein
MRGFFRGWFLHRMVGMVMMVIVIIPVVGRIGVDGMGPVDTTVIAPLVPQIFPLTILLQAPLPFFDQRIDLFFGEPVFLGHLRELITFDIHFDVRFAILFHKTVGALFVTVRRGMEHPRQKQRQKQYTLELHD